MSVYLWHLNLRQNFSSPHSSSAAVPSSQEVEFEFIWQNKTNNQMNKILQYGSIEAIPLYNCSGMTPDEWSLRDGVRRQLYGLGEMLYGVLLTLLYLPIIAVLLEKEHIKMSCYKIMTCLAIIDTMAIWVTSLITGFFAFQGVVYCTYPNLQYITGMFALGLWACSCVTAMSLVINRLIEFTAPSLGKLVFHGYRTFFWIAFCLCYGGFFMVFTRPVVFASQDHAWVFDPMIFPNHSLDYENVYHRYNNLFIVGFTGVLYISFCFVIGQKMKSTGDTTSKNQASSTQIFIQSAIICAFNQIAAIIYVIMNLIDVPFWLIIFAHTMWQLGHGAPALIYTCLNKTIRNGVRRKLAGLGKRKKKKDNISRGPSTVLIKV